MLSPLDVIGVLFFCINLGYFSAHHMSLRTHEVAGLLTVIWVIVAFGYCVGRDVKK